MLANTSRFIQPALMVALMPVALMLAIPLRIVTTNARDIPPAGKMVEVFLAGCIGLAVLLAVLWILGKWNRGGAIAFRALLLACSVAFVSNALQPFTTTLPLRAQLPIDLAITLLFALILARLSLETIPKLLAPAGLALLLLFASDLWSSRATLEEMVTASPGYQPTIRSTNLPSRTAFDGNIYHVVLDGFQGDMLDVLTEQDGQLPVPKEFTYFQAYKSAYWQTHFSIPSTIIGGYYDPKISIADWTYRTFQVEGLYESLHESGFEISQFVYYEYYCSVLADYCDSQVAAASVQSENSAAKVLIDLWFQQIIPGSVRTYLNRRSSSTDALPGHESDFGFSITNALNIMTDDPPLYFHPIHSKAGFDRFIQYENKASDQGRYTFLHLLIPHGPYVLNMECSVELGSRSALQGYTDQSRCALALVQTMVGELRRLGRFENSMIVIQSDHGMHFVYDEQGLLIDESSAIQQGVLAHVDRGEGPTSTWGQKALNGTSDALLLVKFPHQQTSSVVTTPVRPLEVAPTILRAAGIPTAEYRGIPLQEVITGATPPPPEHFVNNVIEPSSFSRYVQEADGDWRYTSEVPFQGKLTD